MKNIILVAAFFAAAANGREIRNVIEGNSSSWRTIRDSYYNSGLPTPCKGFTIPEEMSRKAQTPNFLCGGTVSSYTRFPEKVANMSEWNTLMRAGERADAQKLRQKDSHVEWSGELGYKTYVSWNWTARIRGQNGARCGYHYDKFTCKKQKYRRVCVEVDSDSSGSSGGGHISPGGGGSSPSPSRGGGGGGGYEKSKSPFGQAPQAEPDKTKLAERIGNTIVGMVVSDAHAEQSCHDVEDGYTYFDCYDQIADSCDWEENRSQTTFCQDQSVSYRAEYTKPEANWAPGKDSSYLDILPNRYDLLPGEHEKIDIGINTSGQSSQITPQVVIGNAWNKYEYTTSPRVIPCEYGTKNELNVAIKTVARIKRKSPNALVIPVGRDGKPAKSVFFNEILVGSELLPGHAYEVRLMDESAGLITEAARQSRAFGSSTLSQEASQSTVVNKSAVGTMSDFGFWKDTQFRIRLMEMKSETAGAQLTDDILTNGSVVTVSKEGVKIPLEGDLGLKSIYHPIGRPLLVGWLFGSSRMDQIEFVPGKKYEIRLSMYQRGIPFYESGCKNGALTCEGETANKSSFSEELVLKVQAHEKVDLRTKWQKLVDWQRERNLWKKVKAIWN